MVLPRVSSPRRLLCLLASVLTLLPASGLAQATNLKPDEEIVFFPGLGLRQANGTWLIEVRGCVYEPERMRVALAALRTALNLKNIQLTASQNALFAERARLFMVDHERRRSVVVRFGERLFSLPKTTADGCFSAVLTVDHADVRKPGADAAKAIEYSAALPQNDSRVFRGKVWLLAETGVIVVSDIDDTIKITDVGDRSAVLRNTLLEPFRPVPGMVEFYRSLAERADCHFCYVSASPWQLYLPLSEFVQSAGFPGGLIQLREFRWKGRSVLNLPKGPEKHKLVTIGGLLNKFPRRQFILIGDSGERDPEIYGDLARTHPAQIGSIYIRELGSAANLERYQSAFREVPASVWRTFRDPAELRQASWLNQGSK